jgi:glycosyltransferase involved in cell wall biosynthesis
MMRIAQIAPLAESVPPKLYGGIERVIAWLIDELIDLGHEVTLFASGDSKTRATLIPAWPRALRLGRPRADPIVAQSALLEMVATHAHKFDVLHSHLDWAHLSLLSRLGIPYLTTCHNRLDLPLLSNVVDLFAGASFVSISDNQRLPIKDANWLGTVYHGLPIHSVKPVFAPGKYLAFLGRLTPDKGPEEAIQIAKAASMPLHIAAKIPRAEKGYFAEKIAPSVDDVNVRLVGEVNEKTKEEFLRGAAALLFPIDWPEPFGLVMIEAMACGTPVIAYPRGAVPEVVEDGVTGFIVENRLEAIEVAKNVSRLDRRGVRAAFERRFTARRMAEEYASHYRNLIEERSKSVQTENSVPDQLSEDARSYPGNGHRSARF